jgi:hypothetical protein
LDQSWRSKDSGVPICEDVTSEFIDSIDSSDKTSESAFMKSDTIVSPSEIEESSSIINKDKNALRSSDAINNFEIGIVLSKEEKKLNLGIGTAISIGNARVVITAGHIIASNAKNPNHIFLILPERQGSDERYKIHKVSRVILHPKFNQTENNANSGYDIAFLVVSQTDSAPIPLDQIPVAGICLVGILGPAGFYS